METRETREGRREREREGVKPLHHSPGERKRKAKPLHHSPGERKKERETEQSGKARKLSESSGQPSQPGQAISGARAARRDVLGSESRGWHWGVFGAEALLALLLRSDLYAWLAGAMGENRPLHFWVPRCSESSAAGAHRLSVVWNDGHEVGHSRVP